jgi:hypothetical protein
MMDELEQLQLLARMIETSREAGKQLTVKQAQRKIHREYITAQLWNKYGLKPSGFILISGFKGEFHGDFVDADPRYEYAFNNFLNMNSKLTGELGVQLREAMDKLGIDYRHSPTFPLDDVKTNADVA